MSRYGKPSEATKYQPKAYPLVCTVCGGDYFGARRSRKFCSHECQRASINFGERVCGICEKEFIAKKEAQWLCSPKCRQLHMSRSTTEQRAAARRGKGTADWYVKYMGRHQHRVVAEEKIGRPLLPNEVVHHINEDKKDNRPENLEVMDKAEHARMHSLKYWEDKRNERLAA